ncbi:hypothetical protein EPN42_13050 [bacterium]|nr:MAG: hypothetical protein EPN42_13050 [bacterium]
MTRPSPLIFAVSSFLAVAATTTVTTMPRQHAAIAAVQTRIEQTREREAGDEAWIASYPRRASEVAAREKRLSVTDMEATPDIVESRFLLAVDQLVRRDHLGVRPMSCDPQFVAVGAVEHLKCVVDVVGKYPAALDAVRALSLVPGVLVDVTQVEMSRAGANDTSVDPDIDTKITAFLYRIPAAKLRPSPVPTALPSASPTPPLRRSDS